MIQVQSSLQPLTEFGPTWQIPFWVTKYPNEKHIDTMRQWILDNESRIIGKYSALATGDGGTGLGLNSLTAQYSNFNLFSETADVPEFSDFFKFLRSEYEKFMIAYNAKIRDCSMYSWANVVRPGQAINKHHHGAWHYSYISGNMHFDNYNTKTRYYNPFDEMYWELPNVKGGVTFFVSYLMHDATQHTENKERVSMAFDLFDRSHLSGADTNCINF